MTSRVVVVVVVVVDVWRHRCATCNTVAFDSALEIVDDDEVWLVLAKLNPLDVADDD